MHILLHCIGPDLCLDGGMWVKFAVVICAPANSTLAVEESVALSGTQAQVGAPLHLDVVNLGPGESPGQVGVVVGREMRAVGHLVAVGQVEVVLVAEAHVRDVDPPMHKKLTASHTN